MICGLCFQEFNDVVAHGANCPNAPEDVRKHHQEILARREAYKRAPIVCCEMRKKVRMQPFVLSEAECGLSDSVMADFVVFEEKNTIQPRFCLWCGKPWVVMGIKV